MRISDWSSDVCSSDLAGGCSWRLVRVPEQVSQEALRGDHVAAQLDLRLKVVLADAVDHDIGRKGCETLCLYPEVIDHVLTRLDHFQAELRSLSEDRPAHYQRELRLEEQTSELTSLMRISYAVLCMIKKINIYFLDFFP